VRFRVALCSSAGCLPQSRQCFAAWISKPKKCPRIRSFFQRCVHFKIVHSAIDERAHHRITQLSLRTLRYALNILRDVRQRPRRRLPRCLPSASALWRRHDAQQVIYQTAKSRMLLGIAVFAVSIRRALGPIAGVSATWSATCERGRAALELLRSISRGPSGWPRCLWVECCFGALWVGMRFGCDIRGGVGALHLIGLVVPSTATGLFLFLGASATNSKLFVHG